MQNDVIDLRELFLILKKRIKLILSLTILIISFAIIYVYFIAKPIYQVKATIQIAQINQEPVENIMDLKARLGIIYVLTTNELPRLNNISLPKKTTNLLLLEVHGRDNLTAEEKLQEVVSYITDIQDKELQSYISMQNKKLTLILDDIQRNRKLIIKIETDINNYENKLLNISKQDAALAGIYTIEIGKKQTELNNATAQIYKLKNTINTIELSISPQKIKRTTIIGKIHKGDHPAKPKKILTIIIAFITGLMFSIFLAFFLEFLRGIKNEEKDN